MKFVRTIPEYNHLWAVKEDDKLNECRDFLKQNGVFDQDSFIDFFEKN